VQKEGLILTELYNEKQTTDFTLVSRLLDYGVILTALYPLAAWKIVQGTFMIGPKYLGELVGQFLPVGPWMVWLVGGAFAIGMTLATVMLSGGLFALFRFATDTRNYARPARD
jgi:hypothetical protein